MDLHKSPAAPLPEFEAREFTAYEYQRIDWFEQLGFGFDQAAELATARAHDRQHVTVHDVRVALDRGCSREQALAIFT